MQDENGFTLLEVLISLAIMMIGVLAVIAMHTTSVQNNKVARETTEALHHANKALELIIKEQLSQLNNFTYQIESNTNNSSPDYEIDIYPIPPKDNTDDIDVSGNLSDLFVVSVLWDSFGEERELKLFFRKSSIGTSRAIMSN